MKTGWFATSLIALVTGVLVLSQPWLENYTGFGLIFFFDQATFWSEDLTSLRGRAIFTGIAFSAAVIIPMTMAFRKYF